MILAIFLAVVQQLDRFRLQLNILYLGKGVQDRGTHSEPDGIVMVVTLLSPIPTYLAGALPLQNLHAPAENRSASCQAERGIFGATAPEPRKMEGQRHA